MDIALKQINQTKAEAIARHLLSSASDVLATPSAFS